MFTVHSIYSINDVLLSTSINYTYMPINYRDIKVTCTVGTLSEPPEDDNFESILGF